MKDLTILSNKEVLAEYDRLNQLTGHAAVRVLEEWRSVRTELERRLSKKEEEK